MKSRSSLGRSAALAAIDSGVSLACPPIGEPHAPDQERKQEGRVSEHPQGDQGRPAPEAGRGDRPRCPAAREEEAVALLLSSSLSTQRAAARLSDGFPSGRARSSIASASKAA